jgi:alpha-ketoglutarate-dependent taurine dioxygenase
MTNKWVDIENIGYEPIFHSKYSNSLKHRIDLGHIDSSKEDHQSVIQAYQKYGIARLQVSNQQPKKELKNIARLFGFNSAFVPSQYSENSEYHDEFGINEISHGEDDMQDHKGFLSTDEQSVHVDGTLEPIGRIPTTFMLCSSQADAGGESRFFNSVAAFYQLIEVNRDLAEALCSKEALTRSDVDGSGKSKTGPAFGINQYGLVTRFSLDNTSEWNVEDVEELQEALDWMKSRMTPDSEFYTEFRLKPGDLLIVANHKVSHGRSAYIDSDDCRRHLYRALFSNKLERN